MKILLTFVKIYIKLQQMFDDFKTSNQQKLKMNRWFDRLIMSKPKIGLLTGTESNKD